MSGAYLEIRQYSITDIAQVISSLGWPTEQDSSGLSYWATISVTPQITTDETDKLEVGRDTFSVNISGSCNTGLLSKLTAESILNLLTCTDPSLNKA
jgi:hypothetical protein